MERHTYTRAHIKILRVASLLAVADNYIEPIIKIQHVVWADSLIRNDIDTFFQNLKEGNIGIDDEARDTKVISVLKDYLENMPPASYNVKKEMQDNNIISRSYLQIKTQSLAAFRHHNLGSTKALEFTIQNLISNGYIMEVAKPKLIEAFNFHGFAYRIISLP